MARDRQVRVQSAVELEAQLAAFDQPAPVAPSPTPAPMPRARSVITGGNPVVGGPGVAGSSGSLAVADPMATQIVVRARLARPLAAMVALASSLAAGAWIAALLGVLIAPSSGGEHALIGVIAVAAVAAVGFAHFRVLRPSWASAPAVLRHIRSAARALVAGGLTFGALELAVQGTLAVFGAPALGVGTRVILAGAAAAIGLGWQTLRLGERLRRRIG
jgi:hypothetical protein